MYTLERMTIEKHTQTNEFTTRLLVVGIGVIISHTDIFFSGVESGRRSTLGGLTFPTVTCCFERDKIRLDDKVVDHHGVNQPLT